MAYVKPTSSSGVCRLHLFRIQYFVYYQVSDGQFVVLTLWHSSRCTGQSYDNLRPDMAAAGSASLCSRCFTAQMLAQKIEELPHRRHQAPA